MRVSAAHRTLPCHGEVVNGDAVVLRITPEGSLFSVVDGLGHGPIAAHAAGRATAYLASVSLASSAAVVMAGLHQALRGTRGAAGTVCLLHGVRLDACGVGNVELQSSIQRFSVVLNPGILGVNVRTMRSFECDVSVPVRVVIHSDGISRHFDLASRRKMDAESTSEAIMTQHRKPYDDSSIVVVDIETGR